MQDYGNDMENERYRSSVFVNNWEEYFENDNEISGVSIWRGYIRNLY